MEWKLTSDGEAISNETSSPSPINSRKKKQSTDDSYVRRSSSSQRTLFTEFETIEIALKIIDLVQILHSKGIVHTNLNPQNIFLVNDKTDKMMFLNLYHCSWNTKALLQNDNLGPECEDNLSLYDTRTRNKNYISPEQVEIGNELARIAMLKNGMIDENTYEV